MQGAGHIEFYGGFFVKHMVRAGGSWSRDRIDREEKQPDEPGGEAGEASKATWDLDGESVGAGERGW